MKILHIGVDDLATLYPNIAKGWHPTKNLPLTPAQCYPRSEKMVWWLGPCGHEWEARIKYRTAGGGCPYCSGKRVLKGETDFATLHPQEAKEWHPTLNGELKPEAVTEFSNKVVWWQCASCGNEWRTSVSKRSSGRGCPECADKRTAQKLVDRAATDGNNSAAQYPDLAREWHPTKNCNLRPDQFAPKSNRKAWWKCSVCGFEWSASFNKRANGRGSPECARRFKSSEPEQAIFFYIRKCFADAENPWAPDWLNRQSVDIFVPELDLAIEYDGGFYHGKKRLEGDGKKAAILCEHGIFLIRVRENNAAAIDDGSYQITLEPRETLDALESPLRELFAFIQEKYRLELNPDIDILRDYPDIIRMFMERKAEHSLRRQKPDLAAQWHPTKNKGLTPDNAVYGSHQKVWWVCPLGHEWDAAVNSQVRGNGCPVCAGKIVLVGFNDLATTNPKIAEEWDEEKNSDLTPEMVTAGSLKKVWWICRNGHEWEATIASRTKIGAGCSNCAGKKAIPGLNDLQTLNPTLAAEWHPEKNCTLKPSDVLIWSNRKAWWVCPTCGYEWQAVIASRSRGTACPCCANRVVVPGVNDLKTKFPALAEEWHPEKNGDLRSEDVVSGTHRSVWWKCSACGHEWKTSIKNRTLQRTGCPKCGHHVI